MISFLHYIDTISPFGDIALVLGLWLAWDLLVWLFVAVPWPAPLTIVLCWKCLGFVPMVRRMHARFCTQLLPAPELLSVMDAFKLISWGLNLGFHLKQPVGWKDIE